MRLTDCFMELIAYVAYFIRGDTIRQASFEQVRADIQRLISGAETRFGSGSFTREDYDLARFAVFAWIDEVILSSQWPERQRWQGEQLQRIHYQTADAGEGFFERLNLLGPHQSEVREVYYLCLAMGFMGRYCHEGEEYLLEQLKATNLKVLSGSSMALPSLEDRELFPEAYPPETEIMAAPARAAGRLPLFTLACIGCPVILYAGLFLIYRFILSSVSVNVLSAVQ